jgi:nucleoside-diphosphate-sugar epimerase
MTVLLITGANGFVGQALCDRAALLGLLQVDSSKIRRELNWAPPYLQQGLQATAAWYRHTQL